MLCTTLMRYVPQRDTSRFGFMWRCGFKHHKLMIGLKVGKHGYPEENLAKVILLLWPDNQVVLATSIFAQILAYSFKDNGVPVIHHVRLLRCSQHQLEDTTTATTTIPNPARTRNINWNMWTLNSDHTSFCYCVGNLYVLSFYFLSCKQNKIKSKCSRNIIGMLTCKLGSQSDPYMHIPKWSWLYMHWAHVNIQF